MGDIGAETDRTSAHLLSAADGRKRRRVGMPGNRVRTSRAQRILRVRLCLREMELSVPLPSVPHLRRVA